MDSLSEKPGQTVGIDRPGQAERFGSAADPAAGLLAVANEIVLHTGRDLPGVIRPAVRRDLRQPHHQAPASTGEAHPAHPRCRGVCGRGAAGRRGRPSGGGCRHHLELRAAGIDPARLRIPGRLLAGQGRLV